MRRQYLSAPLPFQGQKRMFAKEFIKVLKHYQDDAVFVDLFGGSGLLSHITKCQKPDATVVYNDFDNYRRRLENIPRTNALLDKIREVVASVPRRKILPEKTKEAILLLIDPPYLSTEVGTYTMNWGLSDYLDVLQTLVGTNYIYFTSNKSSIIELCDWMGRNNTIGNPFTGSKKVEFNARMNYNSSYTDIMLFKDADGTEYKEAV